jgi:BlaI family transcriptional regulator, penicillinase repressor
MARRKSKTLTELELDIMHVVWKQEGVSVEEIRRSLDEAGRPLALPSIRTMLSILQDKGFVERRPEGRGFLYSAVVAEDAAKKNILSDVVERAFDGSAFDMVAALLDSRMVGKKDLDRVRRMIAERERRDGQ